jgi:shikimate kinase
MASDNKKELLEKMMKEREPMFKQADIKIESDLEAHHLVGTIIEKLEAYQK